MPNGVLRPAIIALVALAGGAFPIGRGLAAPGSHPAETILQAPSRFEANQGRSDARVRFFTRGPGYTVLLENEEPVLRLLGGSVRMRVAGSSPSPSFRGTERQLGLSHHWPGNDPPGWWTGVPACVRVRSEKVFSGIDLVRDGNRREFLTKFAASGKTLIYWTFVGGSGAVTSNLAIAIR